MPFQGDRGEEGWKKEKAWEIKVRGDDTRRHETSSAQREKTREE
jgi:hypothetical protein